MIRVITDSTCEAPAEVLAHPAVSVVPLSVLFGQTAYRDGVDMVREEFWSRLPTADPLPTTTQPSPAAFEDMYRRLMATGDEVIVLPISSKLSGTMSSAQAALEGHAEEWPITLVESKSTSIGLGLLLQEAVRLIDAGASRAEIVAKLTTMREEIRILFVVDTLEYLQRGGRIGKAQAFMGTLLKFKPLLALAEGEIHPVARVRSRTKALESAQEMLLQQEPARGPQVRLGITHGMAAAEAERLAREVAARFGTQNYYVAELGSVLGTHVGPGTIGIGVHHGG